MMLTAIEAATPGLTRQLAFDLAPLGLIALRQVL